MQSQGKISVSRDGQARVVERCTGWGGGGVIWKGNDVVEPRKMDLDTTMKYSG